MKPHMISRSELMYGSFVGLGIAAGGRVAKRSTFRGVTMGIQSRSFQDRPVDDAITAMSGHRI
jgi:hypothetical protein